MRYQIQHKTCYQYSAPVSQCLNTAHILPRDTYRQTCLQSSININPMPVSQQERLDYFGNRSCHFSIEQSHSWLEVTSTSLVDVNFVSDWSGLDFGNTCGQVKAMLGELKDEETLLAREFILNSPLVSISRELRDYAAPLFNEDRTFLSAVRDLSEKIHSEFIYDPGFSEISTPLIDVLHHKRGVCQDFAHLAIGCLRSLGFAARYVSGYLETLPPPGQQKLIGSDASHAWFSVFSPGEGWFDLDPTNNTVANEQHIVTAWGRDYTDVAPLRGVIFGGGAQHDLKVSVDVTRV